MALDEDEVLALEPALRQIADALAVSLGLVVDLDAAPSRVWSTDGQDADGFVQHREHRVVLEGGGEVVVGVELAWWNPRELASATLKAFVKTSDGRGAHVFLDPPREATVLRHGGLDPAVVDAAIRLALPDCEIIHR